MIVEGELKIVSLDIIISRVKQVTIQCILLVELLVEFLVLYNVNIPEQGHVVTVRQRRYVVTDILKSNLPSPVWQQTDAVQHLITLSSIEDDALGETLQVVWELEPGAHVSERVWLPDPSGFDTPQRLDAFLNAVRWGAISSADARQLQSPFRSGIDIEDYQLNPLVRAIQMPRVSLLIADDVGLGKTVEAGMVIQELIVRNRARTVLIVCPAGLQIHWRDQMRDKFGLEFRIVDSSLMKELRRSRGIHVNPWSHFPRLITSIDFVKRDRPMRLLREILPPEGESVYPRKFDILLVDEAHNVAPSGCGQYAIDSLRTLAIRTLTPHFEHKLFLSATPHNGYPESFSALLELLDNQRFARGVMPNRAQLDAIMVRRLKSEIKNWDGSPRFPERSLFVLEVNYNEDERRVHRALKAYTVSRQRKVRSDAENFATDFVLKLLKKRLFSSPAAFAATLEQHEKTMAGETRTEEQPRRTVEGILRRQIAQMDEDYANDDEYEDTAIGAVDTATSLFAELDAHEKSLLQRMRDWAESATGRRDSKTDTLMRWLRETVRPNGQWSDERVIIFTEYRATQNWLQTILAAEELAGDRLMLLFGGMEDDKRELVKAAFQAHPDQSPVRILLATDAASEGIDLQNYCHRLVHVEIPWNPNRLEQRNGRIDRHGQQYNPEIYHFAATGYSERAASETANGDDLEDDLEFLMRAVLKVEQIREDLGKVGPVIAEQVEQAMLGRRHRELDTTLAEQDAAAIRRMLKFERDLQKQIQSHYEQLKETERDLGLSPESIREVVETALEVAGQAPLRRTEMPGMYHLPPLSGSWAACSEGLAHPHTGVIRPIVFDRELSQGRDDVVLIHLNHRLVQMAMRLLRAEVWSPEGRRGLHRVTARCARDSQLDTVAVVAHARLVITGGDNRLLHEEVIAAGGYLDKGSFRRMNVSETQAALAAALDKPASDAIQRRLTELWDSISDSLMKSLDARMRDRTQGLRKFLEERATRDMRDMETVLTELARAIETELGAGEYRQLELFTLDERSQLSINRDALRARLEQIPTEVEQEKAVIQARYADPQPRLFPVSVTFLIPERLNRA